MDRTILISLIDKGLSTNEIAKETNRSQTNVRHWLRKFELRTRCRKLLQFKFTDDDLVAAATQAANYTDFCFKLGVGYSGGAFYHYKKRLSNLGVLVEWGRQGKQVGGKVTAAKANAAAIKRSQGRYRAGRGVLHKAMQLAEIPEICTCGVSAWQGQKLKLHIHHKDHDKTNNALTNLEYLCPNCHSIEHWK